MSASITSGTYGRHPASGKALRQFLAGLFGSLGAPRHGQGDTVSARVREANDVRELARSVERESPGFASDLYAAALRHEGLDD